MLLQPQHLCFAMCSLMSAHSSLCRHAPSRAAALQRKKIDLFRIVVRVLTVEFELARLSGRLLIAFLPRWQPARRLVSSMCWVADYAVGFVLLLLLFIGSLFGLLTRYQAAVLFSMGYAAHYLAEEGLKHSEVGRLAKELKDLQRQERWVSRCKPQQAHALCRPDTASLVRCSVCPVWVGQNKPSSCQRLHGTCVPAMQLSLPSKDEKSEAACPLLLSAGLLSARLTTRPSSSSSSSNLSGIHPQAHILLLQAGTCPVRPSSSRGPLACSADHQRSIVRRQHRQHQLHQLCVMLQAVQHLAGERPYLLRPQYGPLYRVSSSSNRTRRILSLGL